MGLYASYQTSPVLEKEGVWRDFGHCRVRIARAGGSNAKYNAHMEKIAKEHQRAIAQDLLGNARAVAIMEEAYSRTVITEWETNMAEEGEEPKWVPGIENPNGGDLLPFTPENVKATLHNLPDYFADIQGIATGLQFFRQALINDAAKN